MKQLLIEAVHVMEAWWAKFPSDMSDSDKVTLVQIQSAIDEPEPQPVADLTDSEIIVVYNKLWPGGPCCLIEDIEFARAILEAMRQKNMK